MSLEVIMGVSIVVTIVLMVGVRVWLQKVVTFKMDEGSIVEVLKSGPQNTQTISAETTLSDARIVHICTNSSSITANSEDNDTWRLES